MPIIYSEDYWKNCWASANGQQSQLKGAILGAGLGRRLDPLTAYHLPKPLFPLGGKVPIAEIWVRRLIRSGITDVSLNLCVLAEMIKRHFENGEKFGIDLTYVEEDTPTGTLGGISKMALGRDAKLLPVDKTPPPFPKFKGSTVIAPSGDIVANFESEELEEAYDIHRKQGASLTMILTEIPAARRTDFGTAILDSPQKRNGLLSLSGRITKFIEKDANSPSCLSNASIYIIEKDLLESLDHYRTEANLRVPEPFYDFGKQVFPALLGELPYMKLPKDHILWGIKFDGPWFDVGNKRDYLRVNERVLDGTIKVPLTYEPLPWGYLGVNVSINFAGVEIRSPVVIGNNCVVESGAILGPHAVIGDGWTIESGAHISNSVLWETYPYYVNGKDEITVGKRRNLDTHEVRRGVNIQGSIIAGGRIEQNTIGQTVDVREDGRMVMLPIDYVPDEPRA